MIEMKKQHTNLLLFAIVGICVLTIPLAASVTGGNLLFIGGDHASAVYEDKMGEEGNIVISSSKYAESYELNIDGEQVLIESKQGTERNWTLDSGCMKQGWASGDLDGTLYFYSHCKKVISHLWFPGYIMTNDTVQVEIRTNGPEVTIKFPGFLTPTVIDSTPTTLNLTDHGANKLIMIVQSSHHFTLIAEFLHIREYHHFDSAVFEIFPKAAGVGEGVKNLELTAYGNGQSETITGDILLDYSAPELYNIDVPDNNTIITEGQSLSFGASLSDLTDTASYLMLMGTNYSYTYYLGEGTEITQILQPAQDQYDWILYSEDELGHTAFIHGNFTVIPEDAIYSYITVAPPAFHDGSEENITIGIDITSSFSQDQYSLIITDMNNSIIYENQTEIPALDGHIDYELEMYENGTLRVDMNFTVLYFPPPSPTQDDFDVVFNDIMGITAQITIPSRDVDDIIISFNGTSISNGSATGQIPADSSIMFLELQSNGVLEGINEMEFFANLTDGHACNFTAEILTDYSAPDITSNVPVNNTEFEYNQSVTLDFSMQDASPIQSLLNIMDGYGVSISNVTGTHSIHMTSYLVPDNYTWTLTCEDGVGNSIAISGNFTVTPYIPPAPLYTNIIQQLPGIAAEGKTESLLYIVDVDTNAYSTIEIHVHDKNLDKTYTKSAGQFATPMINESTEFEMTVYGDGTIIYQGEFTITFQQATGFNFFDILRHLLIALIVAASIIMVAFMVRLASRRVQQGSWRESDSSIEIIDQKSRILAYDEDDSVLTSDETSYVTDESGDDGFDVLVKTFIGMLAVFLILVIIANIANLYNIPQGGFLDQTQSSITAVLLWGLVGIGIVGTGIWSMKKGKGEKTALALLYGEVVEEDVDDTFYQTAFDGIKYDGEMGAFQEEMKQQYEKRGRSKVIKRCKDIMKIRKDMEGLIPDEQFVKMNRIGDEDDPQPIYKPTETGYRYTDEEGNVDHYVANPDAFAKNVSKVAKKLRTMIEADEEINSAREEFGEAEMNIKKFTDQISKQERKSKSSPKNKDQ